jgi:hypothetical protein
MRAMTQQLRIARFVTETGQLRIQHPVLQICFFESVSARVNDKETEREASVQKDECRFQ